MTIPTREKLLGQPLTDAERRTLHLAAAGLSAPQIAARLRYSPDGIKSRKRTLMAKLGAVNTAHAVALAYEHGALTPAATTSCPAATAEDRA